VRADTSYWLSVGCSSDSRDWLAAMIDFYFLFVVIVYFTKKLLLRNKYIFVYTEHTHFHFVFVLLKCRVELSQKTYIFSLIFF
jgi:hypothetical protein